ncbi:lipid asymmetry maintenance protein MlaB [Limnobacter sp.]|uniref:STAS domain-containing protein n=1 Tax=Limnobacter sp. TaxID=2003368 RepID=UPI003517D1C8
MKISADQITVRNGAKVIAEVTAALRSGDSVVDFSGVKHIDSTAIAVLLAAKRVLKTDKTLQVKHAPAQLESLIAAYGVQSLFS